QLVRQTIPFKRSFDFSHFVQKILLYPNSEQTSAKPASASRCSLFLCPPHFDASIAWFWA
ncbi:hypothetical protein N9X04_00650, partial [bacterium]|nr:hypothetical protein [bacterium]